MSCILPLLSILNKELTSLKGIVNKDSEIKKILRQTYSKENAPSQGHMDAHSCYACSAKLGGKGGGWSWLGGERGRERFVKY